MKRLPTYLPILLTALTSMPLAQAADPPPNLLANGDFDLNPNGWNPWTDTSATAVFLTEAAKAEPVVGRNVAYIDIAKPGAADWHIQLYQQPFTLEEGKTYTYSLWARSGKPRTVRMRIIHQGDRWNEYASQVINLDESWAELFVTFDMPADDAVSRAGVIMGGQNDDVWLDHLRLHEGEFFSDLEDAQPQSVEPGDKLATTWGEIRSRR